MWEGLSDPLRGRMDGSPPGRGALPLPKDGVEAFSPGRASEQSVREALLSLAPGLASGARTGPPPAFPTVSSSSSVLGLHVNTPAARGFTWSTFSCFLLSICLWFGALPRTWKGSSCLLPECNVWAGAGAPADTHGQTGAGLASGL